MSRARYFAWVLPEVPHRKRAAGTRFEITFELGGPRVFFKAKYDKWFPRRKFAGVR